ncbi:hypothetical protein L1887_36513 [Cichorium endivia]|nr:hypothetical protein L1887_36513 [Cichorium endivia]
MIKDRDGSMASCNDNATKKCQRLDITAISILPATRFIEEYAIEAIEDWREIDYLMDTVCVLERAAQHQRHCSCAFFPNGNTLPEAFS